ncbi:hypothetical protein MKW98_000831, partial [Papaver atlanticum]
VLKFVCDDDKTIAKLMNIWRQIIGSWKQWDFLEGSLPSTRMRSWLLTTFLSSWMFCSIISWSCWNVK